MTYQSLRALALPVMVFLAVVSFSSTHSRAQSLGSAGTVSGVVVDPNNAVVPNAAVTLENPITGYKRMVNTDATGAFTINDVPPNNYQISVAASGFSPAQQTITVRTLVPINLRIPLTLVGTTETVTVTGSSSGLIFIYVDAMGNLTAGSTVALTCTGCTYASGIVAFPSGSVPLFDWTVTSGNLASGSGVDFRAFLSTKVNTSGPGIVIAENAGASIISVDPSFVSTYVVTVPSTSGASCSTGQFSVDSNYYYFCIAANSWKRVAWGSSF